MDLPMKKPKDVADLASRLANAAATPLVIPVPAVTEPAENEVPMQRMETPRKKAPSRGTVAVFLRMSQTLYEEYDKEAVRRTKATGRGVTVQQVILDRLEGKGA